MSMKECDISDVESQFEEEPDDHDPSYVTKPSSNRPSTGRRVAFAITVITIIVLIVVVPILVATKDSKAMHDVASSLGTSLGLDEPGADATPQPPKPDDASNNGMTQVEKDDPTEEPETEEMMTQTTQVEPTDEGAGDLQSTTATTTATSESSSSLFTTQLACANLNVTSPGWIPIDDEVVGETEYDLSGTAVAMSADGSVIAISSTLNDGNGERAGHVRVFQYVMNEGFQQMGKDLDGEGIYDWFGSSVALDASGRRLVAGGRWNDGISGEDTGHVRVFDYKDDTNSWEQLGEDIEGEAAGDQLGRAVSLSADGTRLAVGASHHDGDVNATDIGQVKLYDLVRGSWTRIGEIDGDGETDLAGKAVSLSADGSHVAIGAYRHTSVNGDREAGQVKVYKYDNSNGSWSLVGQEIEGKAPQEWAGSVVSMNTDGSRVAVGAPKDSNNFLPGSSRVYELQGGSWVQIGSDLKGGYAVALTLNADRVAVGDFKGFNSGLLSGHVFVYEYNSTDWNVVSGVIDGEPGEMSGTAVAISADGQRVAVSSPAHGTTASGQQVGATRVYDLC